MAVFKPTVDGLNDLYLSVLDSLGMVADEDGLISMDLGDGNKIPSNIGAKRMALPTQELLRVGNFEGVVAFHPMAENIYRGESEVLKKLKVLINFRLTTIISYLLTELMEIAVNKDYHSKLTPKQSGFMSGMGDVDNRTLEALTKILNNVSPTGEHRLVSIYLKRGGVLNDANYSRLAVATFPIVDDFDNKDHRILGVKVRVKDLKAITTLFNYILPDADDINAYSHGSNSMAAPYFHALTKSFLKIAQRLNVTVKLFKKHLDNPGSIMVNTSWEESLEDLAIYRDIIPTLDGNDGKISVADKEQAELESRSTRTTKSLFKGDDDDSETKLEHTARKSAMSHLADSVGLSEQQEKQSVKGKETVTNTNSGLSWAEINAKRTNMQHQMPVHGYNVPTTNPATNTVPPGWAGTPVTPQDVYAYNQAMVTHSPRFGQTPAMPVQQPWNQPQPAWNQPMHPQHNMNTPPWNTGGNVYGGGI